jgi:glutamyl-tRNA synthetase
MSKKVRVRFAPSPTGGLHLGGVRTVLYNYLFARHHGGDFVLRIEDTDQSRFVAGAEDYIVDCLAWCGMYPDESPATGGPYAPYRQSERKSSYREYAEKLVADGHAYYAFDTPEDLDEMRTRYKSEQHPSPQYDRNLRLKMRNSLTLQKEEVAKLISDGVPYVIRIKMPDHEAIQFTDMIRGEVSFNTDTVDDKVLLKNDGMPTYHLAVVVDDYAMKITHAFRGEEWLPSAPVHLLLWKYLGWINDMPQWAHLPLILKPDGNGKLSKRDGDRLGFPVFAMNWTDPRTNDFTQGFREKGFLPEAFVNMLAMLGWNDGTGQELFTIEELIARFNMDRVHKGGAKFDFEKAKWFNHEWIKRSSAERLLPDVKNVLAAQNITGIDDGYLQRIINMVKERCVLLPDFYEQSKFFFEAPDSIDTESIRPKWTTDKQLFFTDLQELLVTLPEFSAEAVEATFKELASARGIKVGELQLPFRIMLVGGKFGPAVFDIATTIGKHQTITRIKNGLAQLS